MGAGAACCVGAVPTGTDMVLVQGRPLRRGWGWGLGEGGGGAPGSAHSAPPPPPPPTPSLPATSHHGPPHTLSAVYRAPTTRPTSRHQGPPPPSRPPLKPVGRRPAARPLSPAATMPLTAPSHAHRAALRMSRTPGGVAWAPNETQGALRRGRSVRGAWNAGNAR